jgi:hypothetical protein
MGVRPNIQSPLKIEGAKLVVRGESDRPLWEVLQVVVVQQGKTADGQGEIAEGEIAEGEPERASSNWRAELPAAGFEPGPAETVGVEIRVAPFQVTSWTQRVTIQ